jgi:hypothetical protein
MLGWYCNLFEERRELSAMWSYMGFFLPSIIATRRKIDKENLPGAVFV